MTQFQYLNEGNSEAQDKLAEAYLFAQSSEGIATTGVISGLSVAQTTTASASVTVGAGACIVQASRLNGADRLVNDTDLTLDVLGANPMGGVPRNDIVVFDQAALPNGIRVVVGTPNAVPTDPTVPTTAAPLARIRNLASATTVPAAQIDDLRRLTGAFRGEVLVSSTAQRDALVKYVGLKVYRTDVKREERWDGTGWFTFAYGESTVTTNATGDFSITTGLSQILTSTVENANGGVATGARQNITVAKNAAYTSGTLTGRIYVAESHTALASTTAGIKWNAWGYA